MEWTFILLRCDLLDALDSILSVLGREGVWGGIIAFSSKFALGPGLKKAKDLCMSHDKGTEKLVCDA